MLLTEIHIPERVRPAITAAGLTDRTLRKQGRWQREGNQCEQILNPEFHAYPFFVFRIRIPEQGCRVQRNAVSMTQQIEHT
jgi:hypothetical protein